MFEVLNEQKKNGIQLREKKVERKGKSLRLLRLWNASSVQHTSALVISRRSLAIVVSSNSSMIVTQSMVRIISMVKVVGISIGFWSWLSLGRSLAIVVTSNSSMIVTKSMVRIISMVKVVGISIGFWSWLSF